MTWRRLPLLLAPALPLALALLVLSACGEEPGGRGERHNGPAAPLGFELAMADSSAVSETRDAIADGSAQTSLTLLSTR